MSRGRGIEDLLELLPDFEGVVEEEGPAAAAASSFTIRFLQISPVTIRSNSPVGKPS